MEEEQQPCLPSTSRRSSKLAYQPTEKNSIGPNKMEMGSLEANNTLTSSVESNSVNTNSSETGSIGTLTHRPSGKTIPCGVKENVAFLLQNEENITRRGNGKRPCYVDDCGAWSRIASCKTHYYIVKEDNRLDYTEKKEGKYVKCIKCKRIPLEPQPAAEKIIVFKHYYTSLKRDPTYKRRVSIATQCPENMRNIKRDAVVEYVGKFSQDVLPHGNSKKSTNEYVRTSCSVKRKLHEMTEVNKASAPREVYEQMVLNGSHCAPRDLKQVQNAKY